MNHIKWNYFDRYSDISRRYLPERGEGTTKATQLVTAVEKLIWGWYNNGDVFDNTFEIEGWCNDLSSYANWMYTNTDNKTGEILARIRHCSGDDDYEEILKALADSCYDKKYLANLDKESASGTIYNCAGPFVFRK